jgi:HSP20 family molecular chaperone IbpA
MKSKVLIGIGCFVLGVGVAVVASTGLSLRREAVAPKLRLQSPPQAMRDMDSFFDEAFSGDPLEQMRKMHERIMKEFDQSAQGGGIFDSWSRGRFGGGDTGEVKRREDKNFVYYDIAIKDVDKDKLKVKVEDGQINISGQKEEKSDSSNGMGSYFASSFHRSLPVPPEADSARVQIEQAGDTLTLKFPRVEAAG